MSIHKLYRVPRQPERYRRIDLEALPQSFLHVVDNLRNESIQSMNAVKDQVWLAKPDYVTKFHSSDHFRDSTRTAIGS